MDIRRPLRCQGLNLAHLRKLVVRQTTVSEDVEAWEARARMVAVSEQTEDASSSDECDQDEENDEDSNQHGSLNLRNTWISMPPHPSQGMPPGMPDHPARNGLGGSRSSEQVAVSFGLARLAASRRVRSTCSGPGRKELMCRRPLHSVGITSRLKTARTSKGS